MPSALSKGSIVADIGAGAGYMTWRLAERVGPTGKVYANDIQPEMLELLRKNMQQRKLTNVEAVLGTIDDPETSGRTPSTWCCWSMSTTSSPSRRRCCAISASR